VKDILLITNQWIGNSDRSFNIVISAVHV